jgi:peptide chain release factor 1
MSDNSLLDKYEGIKIRFDEVSQQISDPDIMKDMKRYVKLNQEYKQLDALVQSFTRYRNYLQNIAEAKEILENESDEDLREMAREELEEGTQKVTAFEDEIKMLLVPADPEDSKNAILEIRGGTGGDEAAIFAGDLFRMYSKFCDRDQHFGRDFGWIQRIGCQGHRKRCLRNSKI